MVVGGRERDVEDVEEMLENKSNEKIRMETCCITDVDVVVTSSLPNSRLDLLDTPQRCGRRESGAGKLRVTFSEEELEIHDEDDKRENTDENLARWSKLSRPPYLGWDNPFSPTGSVSQDADLIVRFWKEKKLSKMYCDILEEEEMAVIEEAETPDIQEREMEKSVESVDEEVDMQLKLDIMDRREMLEVKAEPEKFKANCCSIS